MHHVIRQHEDVVNEPSRNFAAKWRWKIASGEILLQYSTVSLSAVCHSDLDMGLFNDEFQLLMLTVPKNGTVVDGEL